MTGTPSTGTSATATPTTGIPATGTAPAPAAPAPASGGSISLLYFAWLRERVGTAAEAIEMPADVRDVAGLVAWLRARGPQWDAAFGNGRVVRCAVNQEFAAPDAPVRAGDEVAFFPPVTGG